MKVLLVFATCILGYRSQAQTVKGKPLAAGAGPFRIIVPGEKKPARDCFQVTAIAIKFAKD